MRSVAKLPRAQPPDIVWASLSDVGKVRPANEDYVGDPEALAPLVGSRSRLVSRGVLFAVADGMGGHARGEIASKLAIDVLYATFYNAPGDPVEMFKKAILTANTAVRRAGVLAKPETIGKGEGARTLPSMGTTLVAALVLGRWLLVGNIGDSRAYLMNDGRLEQVSRDHTYLAEEIRRGLVPADAAETSPFRHLITRSLGTKDAVEVDLFWRPWPDGATLLLATDGLHGVVEELEMETILASRPPDEAVKALVKAAHDGGAPDNVSVVVVHKPATHGKKAPA
jgi:protein phosphatase